MYEYSIYSFEKKYFLNVQENIDSSSWMSIWKENPKKLTNKKNPNIRQKVYAIQQLVTNSLAIKMIKMKNEHLLVIIDVSPFSESMLSSL